MTGAEANESSGQQQAGPTDYDLKIDDQTERFLEVKQRLTYFLISANGVAIGFLVDFVSTIAEKGAHGHLTSLEGWLIVLSIIAGLAGAGASLIALRCEHASYGLHISNRYLRRSFESLPPGEQARWDRINHWARRLQLEAFFLLFVQVLFAVSYFIEYVSNRAG